MLSLSVISILAVLPLTFAHDGHYHSNTTISYSATATATATPAVQTVAVGRDGLVFTPDTITAQPGERVTFEFFPKNHSVVQADFNNPCNPSERAIFSGFIPTANGRAPETFTITVEDDRPIWLYCAALLPRPHCAAGMVAVINPPREGPNTLEAFRELAARTNTSSVPATPNGGDDPSPSPTAGPDSPPQQTDSGASAVVASGGMMALAALFAGMLL